MRRLHFPAVALFMAIGGAAPLAGNTLGPEMK